MDLFDRYFGLKEALERLFGRNVDLVMVGAMIRTSSHRSTKRASRSMRPKSPKLLEDIRNAAAFIRDAARDKTIERYTSDRLLRQAIERNFEVIGGAIKRLAPDDPDCAARIGDYRQIIAFRNVLMGQIWG